MPRVTNDALRNIRIENLKRLLEAGGGSITRLAKRAGKSPQQLSDMLRGQKSFGDAVARSIEEALAIPTGYLDNPNPEEVPVEPPRFTMRKIPLYATVHAGNPTNNGQADADEYVYGPSDLPEDCFALLVEGNSMTPEFFQGQKVFVDPARRPKPGDFVVARIDDGALEERTLKQYVVTGIDRFGRERFDLRPLNQLYPVLHSEEHQIDIEGVVCLAMRDY